jgi:hypothetical protein
LTGVKMSWVTLDRIVSKEALSDQAIRRQLEQNARPLRSHAAGMGDEDLLAKLRGVGVDADREKLAKLCEGGAIGRGSRQRAAQAPRLGR